MNELALARWNQGAHFSEALELADRALQIRTELNDVPGTAQTLINIGQIQFSRRRVSDAKTCFEEAARLSKAAGLGQLLGRARNALGIVAMMRSELDLAERYWNETLDLSQTLGDRIMRATILSNLGELALRRNDEARARDLLCRSADLAHSTGDYKVSSESLRLLSQLEIHQLEMNRAIDLGRRSLEDARQSGLQDKVSLALCNLAEIWSHTLYQDVNIPPGERNNRNSALKLSRSERVHKAESYFRESIRLLEAMGDRMYLRKALRSYVTFLTEQGRNSEAEKIQRRIDSMEALPSEAEYQ